MSISSGREKGWYFSQFSPPFMKDVIEFIEFNPNF